MRNMEQKRAAHALTWANKIEAGIGGGEVVKKIPPLIITNGILATMAFATEQGGRKNPGHYSVFQAITDYLCGNCEYDFLKGGTSTTVEQLLRKATEVDATTLRSLTAESLAYLSYLRRFVSKGGKDGQAD
jgi:CRISPR-associated protein Cmr5